MKQITIVGGGLVGSLLAIFLAKRGHTVNVYERRADPRKTDTYAGRSINLVVSHRGWTALRAAGVEEAVKEIVVPVHARMMHDRDGKLNRVPYSIENRAIHSVSRGELNRRLLTEAEKLPNVSLHFNQKCMDVDLDNARCSFQRAGGEVKEIGADVVFGSDGAFSAVRAKMMLGRFSYSQEYIEHDYKEVAFPANADGTPKMDPQCLHIWPRRYYMMMGLANQDGGFTGTLFMPHTASADSPGFDTVRTEAEVTTFFKTHFADAMPIVPDLVEQYLRNPQSNLVIVRCDPWTYKDKVALIGDAAHAIVPFYGEGMNSGYEDCKVLNDLLNEHGDDNWGTVLDAYGKQRKPNGDAIADLSMRNFVEMRDLVADPQFILRKKIEGHLQAKHPDQWLPLYSQVKFTDTPYVDALREGQRHDRIMEEVLAIPDIENKWDGVEVEKLALGMLKSV
ncbi:MAG: FAD-dependent monooxygenase [Flavobacteriales bacterium]|nr:FAD-dependent monooxygenase [Flavobacteriales bacterium]HQV75720.1 NAD(P)/FAD-dependent oxidoreductase [Flavobacteriales bacterium]HQW40515.1 NAD(P)/FAD-dependent oxidoreductase [Flavobacteriales bacterium]